ncbi:MAG: hypothetical protein IH948_05180, partial [Bacteroidetes bacterium]|nr:hypothetical protein [Bacteroidota bacterium]
ARTPFFIPSSFDVYEDHSGTLWYGTNGSGARRYDGSAFVNFKLKDGNKNRIMCVFEDKKNKALNELDKVVGIWKNPTPT